MGHATAEEPLMYLRIKTHDIRLVARKEDISEFYPLIMWDYTLKVGSHRAQEWSVV